MCLLILSCHVLAAFVWDEIPPHIVMENFKILCSLKQRVPLKVDVLSLRIDFVLIGS